MKSKKAKKNKPIVHIEFSVTTEQREVLSKALDFLMNYEAFSFDQAKISHDCAFEAAEKLDSNECTLTRGEVRASAAAVNTVIQALSNGESDFSAIEEEFPGLISELKASSPTLNALSHLLNKVVEDLRKMK